MTSFLSAGFYPSLYMCFVLLFHQYILSSTFLHTGTLSPPQYFEIILSNNTLTVSWLAPTSLETSIPPTISYYILSNNVTNTPTSINNPAGCKPSMLCNVFLVRMNLMSYGEENTTIFDYNGTILFTFFAVNGAGNGNVTTCIYMIPNKTPGG